MPVTKLKHEAKRAGLRPGSRRFNAYVYGTERKIEARKKRKRARKRRK